MNGERVLLLKTAAEIHLKSSYVENYFLKKLHENIRTALKNNKLNDGIALKRLRGRIVISGKNLEKIEKIVSKIFGVHSIIQAQRFEGAQQESIVACSVQFATAFCKQKPEEKQASPKGFLSRGNSFAVRARVSGNQNFSSRDLNVQIGAEIQKAIPGLIVNLDEPEKELFVEVQQKEFFLYRGETVGPRGLPLGVEGNVAFFFSGKKKDLLAAWLLMKRGCSIFPVLKSKKAESLLKKLVPWNSWRDFAPVQEKDLPFLIKERGILALATADAGVSKKDFVFYKQFDEKFDLPVLRPLLLLPEKEIFLPKF